MQDELPRLQGRWSVISLEMNGAPLPTDTFAGAKVLIQGNKFTSIGMGSAYNGIIEVDGSNDPKTFSMKFTDGPETGNTNFGIYKLEENSWRICLAITGGPAPKKFAAAPGSGCVLETLQRDTDA